MYIKIQVIINYSIRMKLSQNLPTQYRHVFSVDYKPGTNDAHVTLWTHSNVRSLSFRRLLFGKKIRQ